MPTTSNQGRDTLDEVLDAFPKGYGDLRSASAAGWLEVSRHPATASCDCPLLESLSRLYELGYRLVKED